jgi:signal transduction histidine kinase/CheY-like chemotaxis protein
MNTGFAPQLTTTMDQPLERPTETAAATPESSLAWRGLSPVAQAYVIVVIGTGLYALIVSFPRTFPEPLLFATLLVTACLTSVWKVNLPIPLASGSTLSVSNAADLMTLLLLGPQQAVIVAVAGVWTQCTFKVKQRYPTYRTVFSMAAEAITMFATGIVFVALGGPTMPFELSQLAKPLVGAIATYFVCNTGLIAGAIAATSDRTWWQVWRDDFLWSSASFMVAGTAGAAAAIVIVRGEHWKAVLMLAPVYLTYRTYQVFVGRLEDQRRHTSETRRLHQETISALQLARRAEHALAEEKERLASTVAELTRLEHARKHALEREQAARANAEDASRAKDQFLAMVSHELRTPLNAIVGWADMLRAGMLEALDRERACESIYANSKRQAQLIDELLDVARITSGKLRLDRRAVDLESAVRHAVEVVQAAADAKGVQITMGADPSIGTIYGDPGRLQQIAWNLLSNAVKFTPEGGTVHVRVRRVNSAAELSVSDNGIGIPAEFLPWLFEPFRQADASTTRRYGGLGLGLSIVKHLVEAHGGSIKADSGGEGRGATFTVRLPIIAIATEQVASNAPMAAIAASRPSDAPPSIAGIRVLVVDDDRESREVVAANLASRQAVVRTAASAAQAFDLLQREEIDVLLADIGMPGEDGLALIRRLRATSSGGASIPAAALTALARDEDRQHALEAGFQLHLAKPIDSSSLIAAVASLRKLRAA